MGVIVSAGLPTGMEGMMYPIPFSEPDAVLRVARHAEALGFHSVWGNDHMTTQHYVRAEFATPPRFWEPLVTYAFVAAHTTTCGLAPACWCCRCGGTSSCLPSSLPRSTISAAGGWKSGSVSAPIARSSRRCGRKRRPPRRHDGGRRRGVAASVLRTRRQLLREVQLQLPRRRAVPEAAARRACRSITAATARTTCHAWRVAPTGGYPLAWSRRGSPAWCASLANWPWPPGGIPRRSPSHHNTRCIWAGP